MAEEQRTTTTQQQTIAQNDLGPQIISISEFFDFMNLSCRLNDMINNGRNNLGNKNNNNNNGSSNAASVCAQQTSGNSKNRKNCAFLNNLQNQQQQQNKERLYVAPTHVANATSTTRRTQFEIDFKKLAENPLINNLYGFAKSKQQQQQQQTTQQEETNEQQKPKSSKQQINGLHPLLSEKLDYVINEGILDAVLPFICPVSMPSAPCTTTRANKIKHANNNNINCQSTNPLVHTDSRLSCSTISLPPNCSSLDSTCNATDTSNNAEIAAGVCTKLSFVANATGRRKSLSNGKTLCNSIPKE